MFLILNRLRGTQGLWYILMVLGAVNRWRGTWGWFARVFAVVVTGLVYWFSGSWLIAGLIGVGYWFGEMICGWGNHIGNLGVHRWNKFNYFPEDGEAVGARWLTSMIVYPKLYEVHFRNAKAGIYNLYAKMMTVEVKNWSLNRVLGTSVTLKMIEPIVIDRAMMYSRVFLVVRGLYWWLLPMIGIGLWIGSMPVVIVGWLVMALVWPLCAELGYYTATKFSFESKYYGMSGGTEHQEVLYGVAQVLVVLGMKLV